jgi:hypothetical protein
MPVLAARLLLGRVYYNIDKVIFRVLRVLGCLGNLLLLAS